MRIDVYPQAQAQEVLDLGQRRVSRIATDRIGNISGLEIEPTAHGWRVLPDRPGNWGPLYWSNLRTVWQL